MFSDITSKELSERYAPNIRKQHGKSFDDLVEAVKNRCKIAEKKKECNALKSKLDLEFQPTLREMASKQSAAAGELKNYLLVLNSLVELLHACSADGHDYSSECKIYRDKFDADYIPHKKKKDNAPQKKFGRGKSFSTANKKTVAQDLRASFVPKRSDEEVEEVEEETLYENEMLGGDEDTKAQEIINEKEPLIGGEHDIIAQEIIHEKKPMLGGEHDYKIQEYLKNGIRELNPIEKGPFVGGREDVSEIPNDIYKNNVLGGNHDIEAQKIINGNKHLLGGEHDITAQEILGLKKRRKVRKIIVLEEMDCDSCLRDRYFQVFGQ